MPTPDTIQGIDLPVYDDPPAVPDDLALVWYAMISRGIPRFSSEAARDAAYPTPTAGQACAIVASGVPVVVQVNTDGTATGWKPIFLDSPRSFASWPTVPLATGTGTIRINEASGWVQLQTDTFDASLAVGNTVVCPAGAIPDALRPPRDVTGAALVSGLQTGTVIVQASGAVILRQQTGATRTAPTFTAVWQRV